MSRSKVADTLLLKTIGGAIASRRRECGLSQVDLAELSSLHPNSVGRIERGECDGSIVLHSYLYFHLQSSGVRIESDGVFPVPTNGVSVGSLPEIAALQPCSMVSLLANAVRERRRRSHLTLGETARCAAIHSNSLWNFETGLVCPSITTYYHLLRALEVSGVALSQGMPVLY
jgi:transcriptional regulator with XRE-family HTH domain